MRTITTLLAILLVSALAGCASTVFHREKTSMDAVKLVDEGRIDKGIRLLEKLAADGDDLAMLQLGVYCYEGTVMKQDYPKAMNWFLLAYTNQNADAFVNIGVMHHDGNGVPENRKIAYCVFLITHVCGLGSESTQYRANSYLRRTVAELSNEDIKDCFSNYTLGYVFAYLEAKGGMKGIPDEYKPSKANPTLRNLNWWLDGDLDAIYGKPAAEKKATLKEEVRPRRRVFTTLNHTLTFEIRVPMSETPKLRTFEMITDGGLSSGPIPGDRLLERDGYLVFEDDVRIFNDAYRYLAVEDSHGANFIFKIGHPVKPILCDWGEWQQPDYAIRDSLDKFTLMRGEHPASKMDKLPSPTPEIRFKVVQ